MIAQETFLSVACTSVHKSRCSNSWAEGLRTIFERDGEYVSMESFYFTCKRVRIIKVSYGIERYQMSLSSTCLAASFSSHGYLTLRMLFVLSLRFDRFDQLYVFCDRLHIKSIHIARCNPKPQYDSHLARPSEGCC